MNKKIIKSAAILAFLVMPFSSYAAGLNCATYFVVNGIYPGWTSTDPDISFEKAIASIKNTLKSKGYTVVKNESEANYRLDIGEKL